MAAKNTQDTMTTILSSAIREQRKRISKGLQRMQDAHENGQKVRTKTSTTVYFKLKSPERTAQQHKLLSRIKGDIRDGPLMAQLSSLFSAITHSDRARQAVKLKQFETAIKELVSASESEGGANAFAAYDQFVSVIAQNKAKIRHTGNRSTQDKVVAYWKAKISPDLSPPKAAGELLGLTVSKWPNGKDVSVGKLTDWIREAKKGAAREK